MTTPSWKERVDAANNRVRDGLPLQIGGTSSHIVGKWVPEGPEGSERARVTFGVFGSPWPPGASVAHDAWEKHDLKALATYGLHLGSSNTVYASIGGHDYDVADDAQFNRFVEAFGASLKVALAASKKK
jgi:hypothetical protein